MACVCGCLCTCELSLPTEQLLLGPLYILGMQQHRIDAFNPLTISNLTTCMASLCSTPALDLRPLRGILLSLGLTPLTTFAAVTLHMRLYCERCAALSTSLGPVQAPPLQVTVDEAATTCVAGINVSASLRPAAAPPLAVVFSGLLEATLQPTVQLLLCDGTVVADAALAGYPLPSLLSWQSSQVGQTVGVQATKMCRREAVAVHSPDMSLL